MKKIFQTVALFLFLGTASVNGQVTIGSEDDPHPGAVLHLKSDKGVLLPSVGISDVDKFQLAPDESAASATGMMIYNTFASTTGGQGVGLYIWDSSKWVFAGASGVATAIPVESVEIVAPGNVTSLNVSKTLKLSVKILPLDASNKTVLWSSEDTDIATVDQDGLVTAKKAGTVKIHVRAMDGSLETDDYELVITSMFSQDNPQAVVICYNTGTTFNLDAAAGTMGTITYLWEQSSDGIVWASAGGVNNAAAYTTQNLTVPTYFRRKVHSSTEQETLVSEAALVMLSAEFTQPNPENITILIGGTHTFSLGAATGAGNVKYQWLVSDNNTDWETAPGISTNAAYTTPALSTPKYYKRKASSTSECGGNIYSGAALVSLTTFIQGNPEPVTICKNTTTTLHLAVAAGGSGTITYQWEQSATGADGSWANAAGVSTNADYTTPQLSTNMYYRRKATCLDGTLISAAALVSASAEFMQHDPTGVDICYGSSTTFNLAAATGGTGVITYLWQESTDGNTGWHNAPGAYTGVTYTTPNLTVSQYYKRKAECAECAVAITSLPAKVVVAGNQPFTQGNPPDNTTICYNTSTTLVAGGASGGAGALTYTWEESANGTGWQIAAGSYAVQHAKDYVTPNLTASEMYYRRKASVTGCEGEIISTTAKVTVIDEFRQDDPSDIEACYGTTVTFTIPAATGGSSAIAYLWEQSANGTTGWTAATGTNNEASYETPALKADVYYHRKATVTGLCAATITSAVAYVKVSQEFKQPAPGSSGYFKTSGTHTFTPEAATGGTGTITYLWQESLDGNNWFDAPGENTGVTYTTPDITPGVVTYFRRAATATGCGGTIYSAVAIMNETVTGSNGTYGVACYPDGRGCWMVDNSKEGTATYTQYGSYGVGERGYYYTWSQAQVANVCPNGFHLPADAEWTALQPYINGLPANTPQRNNWVSSSELAGDYAGGWGSWGSYGYWWSSSATDRYFYARTSGMNGLYTDSGYVFSVRCLKSN